MVDDRVHQDLLNIMNWHNNKLPNESNTFASIFWNQQFKAATLNNRRQMRWHPAMIWWCFYLHHRSSGAYSTLRNSGVIELLTERTLNDYRLYSPARCGFSAAIDMQLLEVFKKTEAYTFSKTCGCCP